MQHLSLRASFSQKSLNTLFHEREVNYLGAVTPPDHYTTVWSGLDRHRPHQCNHFPGRELVTRLRWHRLTAAPPCRNQYHFLLVTQPLGMWTPAACRSAAWG